jgi:arginine/serine-rich splicing factor 2
MAAARLIVENFPYRTTEDDLRTLFELEGEVVSVTIPVDHLTGQPRGIAFVEMGTQAEARDAVGHLDHVIYGRHRLRVKLAEGWEYADLAPTRPLREPEPAPKPPPPRPHRPERSPGR